MSRESGSSNNPVALIASHWIFPFEIGIDDLYVLSLVCRVRPGAMAVSGHAIRATMNGPTPMIFPTETFDLSRDPRCFQYLPRPAVDQVLP